MQVPQGSIHQYMAQWHSKEFISRCLNDVNSVNPFVFNHVSDWNYLSLYAKVYYKRSAHTRTSLFNLYQQLGYLKPDNIFIQLSSKEKAFTVIVAQPPEGNFWSILPGKGTTTTVGPASFREGVYSQNKVHPDSDDLKPKARHPAKLKTGKHRRPPTSKSVAKYANKIVKKTAFSRDRKGSDISVLGGGSEGEAEQHEVRPISNEGWKEAVPVVTSGDGRTEGQPLRNGAQDVAYIGQARDSDNIEPGEIALEISDTFMPDHF
ncbi:hypothetical protein DFP72DRAFT_860606 [Ephemerocybe angulata]|uniref:Uncharacterized protein n=1 Tax=Ephemerocybe angulata TaxID=980116 RepID=A0A8H6LTQ4_9AGAR|nr:hypothetical protein DFP72DRAFT_860606 [Tulosesus angulatus]